MIYFDNAATGGRKPDTVLTAVQSSLKVCANPGRGGHKLALSCAKLVQDTRNTLDSYFDGYGFDRVIFTKNCTEALNIAILGTLKKGDHVIVSCAEHNSVLRPLEFLKKQNLITYDVCPLDNEKGNASVSLSALARLLTPRTKLVAVTLASNVNGMLPSIENIKNLLPKNVLLLCDGAQAGGHIKISMNRLGIDFLTLAGHKGLLGIQGSGALLFSDRVKPAPILFGGTGSLSISLDMPDFYPDALEAGTLNFPAVVSLLEGIRYLITHEKQIQSRMLMLTAYFLNKLSALHAYTIFSKVNPCGIVAFSHHVLPSEYIADTLSSTYNIAVRGGLHCAPLMHKALDSLDGGLVRVSFSYFNSEREIDSLIEALEKIDHSKT